jgi:hypothetical protein
MTDELCIGRVLDEIIPWELPGVTVEIHENICQNRHVCSKIRSRHFPYTSLERYCFADVFGLVYFKCDFTERSKLTVAFMLLRV